MQQKLCRGDYCSFHQRGTLRKAEKRIVHNPVSWHVIHLQAIQAATVQQEPRPLPSTPVI
jgi:hypothetical protein